MRRLVAITAGVLAFGSGSAAAQPSFLTSQTDQLATPGALPGSELTPGGSLYSGWAELEFRYGRHLRPTDGSDRELLDGRLPVITYHLHEGSVRYSVTAFAAASGQPVDFVRVHCQNTGRRPAAAAWASELIYAGGPLRPDGNHAFRFRRPVTPSRTGYYDQPGVTFDPGWSWAFAGDTVLRDGQTMLRFPDPPPHVTRRLVLHPAGSVRRATDSTPFASVTYHATLAPRAGVDLDYAMPVVPVPASAHVRFPPFDRALSADRAYWDRLFGRSLGISVPEPKVQNTFYASLATIVESRYETPSRDWVQTVNKLQYNAFWLRDSAFIANALDLGGLHDLAGEDVAFFPAWQQPDGLFISRPQQYDGFGEALWAVGEHGARSGDRAFDQMMLEPVSRAMSWFENETASEPWHLLPASTPGDNELTTGHITGDNLLAADGVAEAVELARRLGRADLASRWAADLSSFRADLLARLRAAEAHSAGAIPPALEGNGGEDWGNLWAAYPEPFLSPFDPAVSATLAHVRARFREGIATYYNGRDLHDYLGFRVFETELLRGEQRRVIDGLYSELAHTTSTGGGFEIGVSRGGARALPEDLAPHGWFAAEYMTLLRNMLIREDGSRLVLLGAPPPGWLRAGRRVAVHGADTLRGRISFALSAVPGGAVLHWRAALLPGTSLVWPVPAAAHSVHAAGLRRGVIVLRGSSGTLRVRWRLRGPYPSAAATARAVLSAYSGG